MTTNYTVEIIDIETNDVIKSFKPQPTRRNAERIEDGVNINLNHDRYFTTIKETTP